MALDDLVTTARNGRSTAADMALGTLTIADVGVFGVEGATPILNPGEAAIVAPGAVRRMPRVAGSARSRSCPCPCPSTTASSTASWGRVSSRAWLGSSNVPRKRFFTPDSAVPCLTVDGTAP